MKLGVFRGRWRWAALVGVAVLVASLAMPLIGLAAGLTGSDFEIDDNANLLVDVPGNLDWTNVAFMKQDDLPSGASDDSFGGGVKEDTAIPSITTGSIPPNKSDLKEFGVFTEKNADGNFLHLFWSRVQDPSGTTNMDFEFNQSTTLSPNGVTPLRTIDDILITYDLSRGGTVATISLRYWDGSAWGPAQDLSAAGAAYGSINTSVIPYDAGSGLGPYSPRTFGEASINLDVTFGPGECRSFGSAYLKSRASDSFTSQLKDFIAPLGVAVSNCGGLTIVKNAVPKHAQDFGFTVTGPDSYSEIFSLDDDNDPTLSNAKTLSDLFAGEYVITEGAVSGWDLTDLSCVAGNGNGGEPFAGAVYDEVNRKVTVTLDADDDVTCTFTNTGKGTIIVAKQTIPTGSGPSFQFTTSYGPNFSLSHGQSNNSGPLTAGTYSVAETLPPGWEQTSAICSDGSPVDAIELQPGETVTCTFTNTGKGTIIVAKQTDPDGSEQSFQFTTSYGPNFSLSDGQSNNSGLLTAGTYSVAETLPPGWEQTSATCSDGSSVNAISLQPGATVTCTFTNTGKGNIIVAKQTIPTGSGPSFQFTTSYGPNFSLSHGQSNDSGPLTAGTYSVAETVPAGWDLTSATCSDGSPVDAISLQPGETVTCTFTNTQKQFVVIVLVCQEGGGLYPSTVNGETSLGNNGFTDEQIAFICGLGGARFTNLTIGAYDYDVNIPD